MSEITKPSGINIIWASGGDKIDPGNVKYQTGWAVELPPRQWENFIQNKQDQAIAHINQHGVPVWDSATEYQANKSYTQGPTNGLVYKCVSTNINQNPETDVTNTYWKVAFASSGDFYTKTESDNLYLAKAQNGADIPNPATFRTNISAQPVDATLTALAGVTTAADKLIYATAADTFSTTTLTSFSRTLLANSNAASWLSTLGVTVSDGGLGYNQTWQNVTSSRAFGVTYTNTTNKPIFVSAYPAQESSKTYTLTIGGVVIDNFYYGNATLQKAMQGIVPVGATYRVDTNSGTLSAWLELR